MVFPYDGNLAIWLVIFNEKFWSFRIDLTALLLRSRSALTLAELNCCANVEGLYFWGANVTRPPVRLSTVVFVDFFAEAGAACLLDPGCGAFFFCCGLSSSNENTPAA